MKVIIAGSRHIFDRAFLDRAIALSPFEITTVVCGCARGIDRCGAEWAYDRELPVDHFPANWDKYGIGAGPIRNRQMADHADAAIVIWDGKSRGSKNMIEEMQKRNKPVHVVIYEPIKQDRTRPGPAGS